MRVTMDVIAIHCYRSNTKYLTPVGINECDCRVASLLAMTKGKKLLAMINSLYAMHIAMQSLNYSKRLMSNSKYLFPQKTIFSCYFVNSEKQY
jgi:hypothetical protein